MTVLNVIRQSASCDLVDLTTPGEKKLGKRRFNPSFSKPFRKSIWKKV